MAYLDQIEIGGVTHDLTDTKGRAMIAPKEASSTASMAHATGTYFTYNDLLYQATSDIAVGGTITPNTNCKAVTLGSGVSDLKSAINSLTGRVGNIVDPSKLSHDKYIRKSDHEIANADPGSGWCVTEYIPVIGSNICSINCIATSSSLAYGYNVYDGNKNYIRSGSRDSSGNCYTYTSGDYYIRLCFINQTTPMANYGSTALTAIEFNVGEEIATLKTDNARNTSDISELKENTESILESILKRLGNIVDPSKLTHDKYISKSTHGIVDADPGLGWCVTDYIPVIESNICSINCIGTNASLAYGYNVYDAEKNYIRSGSRDDSGNCYTYENGDYYIRLCFIQRTKPPMANYGSTALTAIEFNVGKEIEDIRDDISNFEIPEINDRDLEVLITKVLMIGDSTCEGLVSDYPYLRARNNRWSSAEYLSRMNGWEIQNDGHYSYNAIDWINEYYATGTYNDFQLATIDFGYNGDIPDTIATDVAPYDDYHDYANTGCGNYCRMIAMLKEENPYMIILPIIQNRANQTTKNGIKAICTYFNLHYIDLTTTDLGDAKYHGYYSQEDQQGGTIDYVHFTIRGYAHKAQVVRKMILDIFKDNATDFCNTISQQQARQYSN